MAIVYSLHFKRSAEQYVRKAKEHESLSQYSLALEEWKKALNEGYYLAIGKIASLYATGYVSLPGYSRGQMCQEAISLHKKLLTYDIREFDYKRSLAGIGFAYEELGYDQDAYNYYVRAEEEGYYFLYSYYRHLGDEAKADQYYDKYSQVNHKEPDNVYFDL